MRAVKIVLYVVVAVLLAVIMVPLVLVALAGEVVSNYVDSKMQRFYEWAHQ